MRKASGSKRKKAIMAENEFMGNEIPEDLLQAIAGGMTDL